MSYTPNIWVDREGTTRYFETIDTDGAKIFTPDYSQLTEIGTPVNADHMNHIEEGIANNDKRITVLEEGTDPKQFLNKTQITNCILEIPQDIKLELNDGVLTLKAGSKVIVPNGFEADGSTPRFDEVVIESDVTVTSSWGTVELIAIYIRPDKTPSLIGLSRLSSGTTAPTATNAQLWYDTTSNLVKNYTKGALDTSGCSFPIAICTKTESVENNVLASIDQTFNGFGYIGSTVFVTKGVKGLRPNGRNEDGSLNNREFTTSIVKTRNLNGGTYEYIFGIGDGTNITWTSKSAYSYNESDNRTLSNGGVWGACVCGELGATNGQITSFTLKQPFRAVDYSDFNTLNNNSLLYSHKSTISSWSMPSKKATNLTLNASGSRYTMPATGWLSFGKRLGSNTANYIEIKNDTIGLSAVNTIKGDKGNELSLLVPVRSGDVIGVLYDATGETTRFKFFYAEGEV